MLGFNWATSFQTWKCIVNFSKAKSLVVSGVSIGPRLFRHGNPKSLKSITCNKQAGVFQLGHVFSDMEMWRIGSSRMSRNQPFGFQLGHVFSDMEIIEFLVRTILFVMGVSIGPRLFRHGNFFPIIRWF